MRRSEISWSTLLHKGMKAPGGEGTKAECTRGTGKSCSTGQQGTASKAVCGLRREGQGGGDEGVVSSSRRGRGNEGARRAEIKENWKKATTRKNGERGVETRLSGGKAQQKKKERSGAEWRNRSRRDGKPRSGGDSGGKETERRET